MNIKVTLVAFLAVAFLSISASKAQILYQEDFENGLDGWTTYDVDGDGYNWAVGSYSNSGSGALQSDSWLGGAVPLILTPDNMIISDTIDLTNAIPPLTLSYVHVSPDADWDSESYEVFISEQRDSMSLISASAIKLFNMDGINTYTKVEFEIDNSYLGKKIFIAFRHRNSTDQYFVAIDDIKISEPIKFDMTLTSPAIFIDNDYPLGEIPFYLLGDINYSIGTINEGTENASGVEVNLKSATLNKTTSMGTVFFGDTLYTRGTFKINAPLPGNDYTIDEVCVTMDSSDIVPENNCVYDPISSIVNISEDYYTFLKEDSVWFLDSPMEEYIDADGNPTGIYYDPNDPNYTIIADRFTNNADLLEDPDLGPNKKVMFGQLFDFKSSNTKPEFKVNLREVKAAIGPLATGQDTWVEVYDYYNWTNTIGLEIKPVLVSDTMQVPSGWDDQKLHMLSYSFDQGQMPLKSGKYYVFVCENGNDNVNSIGFLPIRNLYEEETSVIGVLNPEDSIRTYDPDFFFAIGGRNINYTFPISLVTQLATGVKEEVAMSVSVYPNPAADDLNIAVKREFGVKSVRILDANGRVIKTFSGINGKENLTVNVKNFANGTYFVEINNGTEVQTQKFIKQ